MCFKSGPKATLKFGDRFKRITFWDCGISKRAYRAARVNT